MAANSPYTDPAKNAFVKTNLFYTDNSFLQTQDPTVLGFKIMFNFDNPNSGLLWGTGMADGKDAPTGTAMWYLNSIGDTQRALYLSKFLYLLHGINNQTPWFFQEIGGLNDAWKRDFSKPLLIDKKLEISCLESIDLRMTALLDLYRKACFDWKYRREVVPLNLRQFQMVVYVYESRIIGNPNDIATTNDTADVEYGFGGNLMGSFSRNAAQITSKLTGPNETLNDPTTANVNIAQGLPMSTTRNMFKFDFCEIDHMESDHLSSVSNAAPENSKQKIVIKYQDVEEINMYNFWDQNLVSDGWIPALDNAALDGGTSSTNPSTPAAAAATQQANAAADSNRFQEGLNNLKEQGQNKLDAIKKAVKDAANLDNIKENLFDRVEDFATGQFNRLLMGNVYGFSANDLLTPKKLVTKVLDAGASIVNDKRFGTTAGGQIFDNIPTTTDGNINSNVYSDSPDDGNADSRLDSNVYSTPSPSESNTDPDNSPNSNIFE